MLVDSIKPDRLGLVVVLLILRLMVVYCVTRSVLHGQEWMSRGAGRIGKGFKDELTVFCQFDAEWVPQYATAPVYDQSGQVKLAPKWGSSFAGIDCVTIDFPLT